MDDKKYQKILVRIIAMEPGTSIQIRHPDGNPYERSQNFRCEVKRRDDTRVDGKEYEYIEYCQGIFPDTYFSTDDPKEMAEKVIKYLDSDYS